MKPSQNHSNDANDANAPEVIPDDEWDDSEDETLLSLFEKQVRWKETEQKLEIEKNSGTGMEETIALERAGKDKFRSKQSSQVHEIGSEKAEKYVHSKPLIGSADTNAREAGIKHRKRRRKTSTGDRRDWGSQGKGQSFHWVLWTGFGTAIVLIAFLVLSQKSSEGPIRESDKPMFTKLAPVAENPEKVIDPTAIEKFLEKEPEAKALFKKYTDAMSVDEVLGYITKPEKVGPILRVNWKPSSGEASRSSLGQTNWKVINDPIIGIYGVLTGENPDFSVFTAYFVMVDGELKLDWKATVAYSSAKFSDLYEGGGDASEVRVWMAPTDFYTLSLPDSEWVAFRLSSPERDSNLWGYLPVSGRLFEKCNDIFKTSEITGEVKSEVQVTLKLKLGPEDSLPNQWIIQDILQTSWLEN